jgi:hypothetical protein
MRKLIAVIIIASLFSCKKNQDANYHVSFTVDGVNKSFTGYAVAHIDTSSGYSELQILGANSPTGYDNYMGVYLNNYPGMMNLTPGLYKDSANNYTLLTTYTISFKENYAGQSTYQDAQTYNVTIANPFKVNITSMDKNSIRGTLSGDYYSDTTINVAKKITITNGDFYVPFK